MSKTMSRAFGCPQKYIQGPGEIANLPTLSAEYGKKPFFVIDSGVMALMFDKINTAYPIWAHGLFRRIMPGEH